MKAGVQINSSLSTALALSPQLKTFERAPTSERQQLHNLAHWAYRFSPTVCLGSEAEEQHLLLIEIIGSLKLFKNLQNILKIISDELNTQKFSFTMGLAHTPKAATLLAFGSQLLSKPPPFESVPDRNSSLQALRQLPLSVLHNYPRVLDKLGKFGLNEFGQLLDLPSSALGKRFGRDFQKYLKKLCGDSDDPQHAIKPIECFASQLFFLEPIENTQMLLFPMQRLLDEFCRFLLARQLQCNHFSWVLHQGGKQSQLDIRLGQAQVNKNNFLNLTRIQLEKLCLNQGVHTVELRANHFVPANTNSHDLFANANQSEPLDTLLDKLQARLGQGTVYCIDCEPQHLPEQASKATSVRLPGAKSKPPLNECSTPFPARPAWLLREPARIQQREHCLYWRGKLDLLQGPERIETAWWNAPQQRDYYIAEHEEGCLYWVYQDIPSKAWYVQGLFS
ncbi:MAG: DNA polymerase Y family protein [Pseudomonadales bacterium]